MSTTEANPRDAAADARTLNEIDAAIAAPDLPRAVALAKRALQGGLKDPLLYNLVASELRQQGRYAEALAQLELAYDMAPRDVLIINAVGRLLVLQTRTDEAIKVYDAALAIEPDLPQTHLNKADLLATQSEFDKARYHYERALAAYPDYADAFAGLASLAMRRNALDEAKELAERALALTPRQEVAILVLAEIETGRGAAAAAEARVEGVLATPGLGLAVRSRALSIKGDALHELGRTAEAFAAYDAAGQDVRRLHAPQYGNGAPGALEKALWLIARFQIADPADWMTGPPAAPTSENSPRAHVFFTGFPRSGTTLLEQILASHPDVVALDEREVLADSTTELFASNIKLDRLIKLDAAQAATYRQSYWRGVSEYVPDVAGKVFVDKHPLNSVRLPLIGKLFPNAKVLFALRDPRDVVLSCFRRRFGMNTAMYQLATLEGAAEYYDAVMRLVELYKVKLPLPLRYVRYESLVEDLKREVEGVCEYIGVEWNDSMLNFVETARKRVIRTPSARQVERGLYSEGVGQWRAYAAELAPVMPLLAPWVEKFGYPAD